MQEIKYDFFTKKLHIQSRFDYEAVAIFLTTNVRN